jgi:hypothetical protein
MSPALPAGADGMYGIKDSPIGRIGGDSEATYGMWLSPMVGRGDSARSKGIRVSPIGPNESDDGRGLHRGELAMDDLCLLVKPMASLGGPSMLILSKSSVSIRLISLRRCAFTICACSCISLNAQLMSSSDEFRLEC